MNVAEAVILFLGINTWFLTKERKNFWLLPYHHRHVGAKMSTNQYIFLTVIWKLKFPSPLIEHLILLYLLTNLWIPNSLLTIPFSVQWTLDSSSAATKLWNKRWTTLLLVVDNNHSTSTDILKVISKSKVQNILASGLHMARMNL